MTFSIILLKVLEGSVISFPLFFFLLSFSLFLPLFHPFSLFLAIVLFLPSFPFPCPMLFSSFRIPFTSIVKSFVLFAAEYSWLFLGLFRGIASSPEPMLSHDPWSCLFLWKASSSQSYFHSETCFFWNQMQLWPSLSQKVTILQIIIGYLIDNFYSFLEEIQWAIYEYEHIIYDMWYIFRNPTQCPISFELQITIST